MAFAYASKLKTVRNHDFEDFLWLKYALTQRLSYLAKNSVKYRVH